MRHAVREACEPRFVTVVQRPFQPAERSTQIDALVVLAAGSGIRAGGSENKVYALVNGRPLLWYPLSAAANFVESVRVVVVIRPEDEQMASAVVAHFPHLRPQLVFGGATRHESERAGLAAIAEVAEGDDLIGIHDGARPFLTVDLWTACATAARSIGGAIPLVEAGALYRLAEGALSQLQTIAYRAQTPQVFRATGLLSAFQKVPDAAPDTAATVMRHGSLDIAAIPGDHRNLKVTFPADLDRASQLADLWRAGRWLTPA